MLSIDEHHWDMSSTALVSQRSIIDVNELDWKAVPCLKVIGLRSAIGASLFPTISGNLQVQDVYMYAVTGARIGSLNFMNEI